MTRGDIQSKVIEAVREILRQSGYTDNPATAPDTKPVGDLPGFDSLNGEEATVLLEAELGCQLPQNVFIAEGPRRALRIHETVDQLCQRLGVPGEEGQT